LEKDTLNSQYKQPGQQVTYNVTVNTILTDRTGKYDIAAPEFWDHRPLYSEELLVAYYSELFTYLSINWLFFNETDFEKRCWGMLRNSIMYAPKPVFQRLIAYLNEKNYFESKSNLKAFIKKSFLQDIQEGHKAAFLKDRYLSMVNFFENMQDIFDDIKQEMSNWRLPSGEHIILAAAKVRAFHHMVKLFTLSENRPALLEERCSNGMSLLQIIQAQYTDQREREYVLGALKLSDSDKERCSDIYYPSPEKIKLSAYLHREYQKAARSKKTDEFYRKYPFLRGVPLNNLGDCNALMLSRSDIRTIINVPVEIRQHQSPEPFLHQYNEFAIVLSVMELIVKQQYEVSPRMRRVLLDQIVLELSKVSHTHSKKIDENLVAFCKLLKNPQLILDNEMASNLEKYMCISYVMGSMKIVLTWIVESRKRYDFDCTSLEAELYGNVQLLAERAATLWENREADQLFHDFIEILQQQACTVHSTECSRFLSQNSRRSTTSPVERVLVIAEKEQLDTYVFTKTISLLMPADILSSNAGENDYNNIWAESCLMAIECLDRKTYGKEPTKYDRKIHLFKIIYNGVLLMKNIMDGGLTQLLHTNLPIWNSGERELIPPTSLYRKDLKSQDVVILETKAPLILSGQSEQIDVIEEKSQNINKL